MLEIDDKTAWEIAKYSGVYINWQLLNKINEADSHGITRLADEHSALAKLVLFAVTHEAVELNEVISEPSEAAAVLGQRTLRTLALYAYSSYENDQQSVLKSVAKGFLKPFQLILNSARKT